MAIDTQPYEIELAQRYALWQSAQWQRLLTHLEWRSGFAFIVLLIDDSDGAALCRDTLSRYFAEKSQTLSLIRFVQPEELTSLGERMLETVVPPATGAVWVEGTIPTGSEARMRWEQAWRDASARFNRYRNTLQRQYNVPVIFAGAPWLKQVLREAAPDLWSVRTLVAHIEPATAPFPDRAEISRGALETIDRSLEGFKLDPEYALQSAATLRGKPGQENLLSSLLHRAGVGFLARRQWQRAEDALAEAVALRSQVEPESEAHAESLYGLSEALQRQYLYDPATRRLKQALEIYCQSGAVQGEANCIQRLGDIALRRSDHASAKARYEEALPLYRQVGDVLGEAHCIRSLGDIALDRSDHASAKARYEEAWPLYRQVDNRQGEADCIQRLGDIALERSNHLIAKARYEEALPLYRMAGDVVGEADCIQRLGEVALARSDHTNAKAHYEEAMPLYRQVGDVLGEADCIKSLGDIAFERSDHSSAKARYEEALPLYHQVGSVLGEANCIGSLGDIALARSDHSSARARYEEALSLYRQVGAVVGEADCIRGLGDIALARSDHASAKARYEEALPLYRQVGAVQGEANCIKSLGDIALARLDHAQARKDFEAALELYRRISEPYSIGQTYRRLARLAADKAERERLVEAAHTAWQSIDRPDLVWELDREFQSRGE